MGFKYSCFISYPRIGQDYGNTGVVGFVQKLKKHLDIHAKTILTRQVEAGMDEIFLSAGDHLDHQIEKVICKSLCYIVVFTKTYIDEINPYCARELASILRHQNERFKKLREFGPKGLDGYNLIIPIILSGSFEGFPKVLKNKGVLSFDFSRRSLWLDEGISFDIKEDEIYYRNMVRSIVKIIEDWCKLLMECNGWNPPEDCFGFENLPLETDLEVQEMIMECSSKYHTLFPQMKRRM